MKCVAWIIGAEPLLGSRLTFCKKGNGFQKGKQKAEPWDLLLLLLSLHGLLRPGTWQPGRSGENTDQPLLREGLQSAATVTLCC